MLPEIAVPVPGAARKLISGRCCHRASPQKPEEDPLAFGSATVIREDEAVEEFGTLGAVIC